MDDQTEQFERLSEHDECHTAEGANMLAGAACEMDDEAARLTQLHEQLSEFESRWFDLQAESSNKYESLLRELRREVRQLVDARRHLEADRREFEQKMDDQSPTQFDSTVQQQIDQLKAERDDLRERLAEVEATNEQSNLGHDADDELHERLKETMAELEQLKSTNAKLEQKLAAQPAGAANPPATPTSGNWDWESYKQNMLDQLESDFDDNDEQQKAERVKIEDVIHNTEQTMAQKDEEIQELKRLLDEQSSNLGDMAVGAAAIGQMFDQDQLIVEERENLRAMQDHWREKMRKAEIEISTERAKLARERNDLEEKLLMLERAQPRTLASVADDEKPARRHWLARLGLADSDDL